MTFDEFKRLDPKKVGTWPALPKIGVLVLVLLLIMGAGYWFDWKDQLEQIDAEAANEAQLKKTFVEKKTQALDLPAYRKQLEDIEKQFGALLKQLPGKSEIDALLTDINQAGLGRGLQFELFKPAAEETVRDFYAELPISIRITGAYHDMGAFASDVGKLSRIVTLNDIALSVAKDNTLVMDATAKTFRYLDEDEVAAKKKAAMKDKKGGKS
ncbi:MAG TPA: type 4a pilus biogenesis protein PilO [Burkholderiales bacterium]|nr:type 4a pilus biogenesis protein PilO [Burkholderiales bacterium]